MEHTHTGSFQYTDTILTNWFRCNAKSMNAIEKLDTAHSEKVSSSYKTKASSSRPKKAKSFEQRTYDYDELELRLIADRDKKLLEYQKKNNSNT